MKSYLLLILSLLFILSCKHNDKSEDAIVKSAPEPSLNCVPAVTDAEWYKIENKAPLLPGMDVINYPITTKAPLAQTYFNQGMALAYGFNHAEAARSFYYATKLDPECAMCYFGYAYVLGPNYNAGMEDDNYKRAYEAIQKAKLLSENAFKTQGEIATTLSQYFDALINSFFLAQILR